MRLRWWLSSSTTAAAAASTTAFLLPQSPFEQCTFGDGPCGGKLVQLPGYEFNPFNVVDGGRGGSSRSRDSMAGGGDDGRSSSPFLPSFLDIGKMAMSAIISPPPRRVSIWLPPGYGDGDDYGGGTNSVRSTTTARRTIRNNKHGRSGTTTNKGTTTIKNKKNINRHPVLYCHDGQNAITDESSWTGHSWRLGGALCSLVRRGLLPPEDCPIVVLIPSLNDEVFPGIRQRHLEYDSNFWGEAYVDEVVQTVKPLVDATYRTRKGPNDTMSIGSSLGGQVAFLSALRYPDVFGGAAALSPCFNVGTLASLTTEGKTLRGKKLYIDNGGDVDDIRVPLFDPLDHINNWNPGYFWIDTMLQPGIDAARGLLTMHGVDHEFRRVPGARHNERAWAKRIDRPLLHLFRP